MLDYFRMFADYNCWANRRIYAAAAELSDAAYRQETGAFFGSVHRTLNHILVADRVWQKRFTGQGDAPGSLDTVLYDDLSALTTAREAEDKRISSWIDGLSETALGETVTYSAITNPVAFTQPLWTALCHVLNHQTHHRGQVHGIITTLGGPSLVLDMVYFQRNEGKRWLDNHS